MLFLRAAIIIFAMVVFSVSAVVIIQGPRTLATVSSQEINSLPPISSSDIVLCANNQCANNQVGRLRSAIYSKWLRLEASSLGLTVSGNQISQRYQVDYQTSVRNRTAPPTREQTESALLANSISEKISEKISTPKVAAPVSEQANPQTIRRNLQVIRTSSEAQAISARRAIERGKTFAATDKLYRTGAPSSADAYYRSVAAGVVGPQIEKILQASPPGTLLPIVSVNDSFLIIKFVSVAQPQVKSVKQLTKEAKGSASDQALLPLLIKKWRTKTLCTRELFNNFCGGQL